MNQILGGTQLLRAWLAFFLFVVLIPTTIGQQGTTTRVSVTSSGEQGMDSGGYYGSGYYGVSTSTDGRFVAYSSLASNLVPGDTNGYWDAFVHDRLTGQNTRVSVSSSGEQGNDSSGSNYGVSISADGRYVAFSSYASNLVPGDTNGAADAFVHDRQTGQTTRVSVSSSGEQGDYRSLYPVSISADGRYVAFSSYASNLVPGDTNGYWDAFVHDRNTGQTSRVSVSSSGEQGNYWSGFPSISADGRYVAFSSDASNLVPDDTNANGDVFVHDRQTGQTSRVSVSSSGGQGTNQCYSPEISADGRYVAFSSSASTLVLGDTNGWEDVFVHDRNTGQTSRVSVSSAGVQGNANTLAGVSISADGRYLAFGSTANNLVPGDTNGKWDVFVRDRQTGQTSRVSVSSSGEQGNGHCNQYGVSISADGRYVAFGSTANNLVPGDTNGVYDVFVHQYYPNVVNALTINPDRVTGGTSAIGTVSLREVAGAGGSNVVLSSSNTSVATIPALVFVPQAQITADFGVTSNPVSAPVTVTITATMAGESITASLIVRAPILTSVTLNPQIQTGGLASTGRINLSGPAPSGFVVTLTKSSGSITIPTQVTIPEGATFATFPIETQAVSAALQAQIVARRGTVQRAAILFLYPTTLDSITISPTTVHGGVSSIGTVHLTLPAPPGGANVYLVSMNPSVANVPSLVFVPAGQTSRTFTVMTSAVGSTTNVSIQGNRNGVFRARVVTVTP